MPVRSIGLAKLSICSCLEGSAVDEPDRCDEPKSQAKTEHDLAAMIDDIEVVALYEAQREVATGSLAQQHNDEAGREIANWDNYLAQLRAELANRSLGQAMP
jgi:hypothetical protein